MRALLYLAVVPLILASCRSVNTRWGWIIPESSAVNKKRTQGGIIVYDPSTYRQAGDRMKWYGKSNAVGEAEGLGVLTLRSEDGSQVTDAELGEMKSGYFQGTVFSNHKTGGRAIWKYEKGSKIHMIIAWDNHFYQRPTTPGWEERFPPIGDPNQDWGAFVRAEQAHRDEERERAKILAAKKNQGESLSFTDQFILNVMTDFIDALTNSGSTSSSSNSSSAEGSTGFKQRYADRYTNFVVTYDGMDPKHFILGQGETNYLVLRSSYGDKISVRYSGALQSGSGSSKPSLEGTTMSVRFSGSGEPESLKNLSNGKVAPVRSWGHE